VKHPCIYCGEGGVDFEADLPTSCPNCGEALFELVPATMENHLVYPVARRALHDIEAQEDRDVLEAIERACDPL